MNVSFNEEYVACHRRTYHPDNTPQAIVERKRAMLTKLGEFIGADSIKCQEAGDTEFYSIIKGGKRLFINIKLKNDHYTDPPNEAWLEIEVE
jgi:hypothetical protein